MNHPNTLQSSSESVRQGPEGQIMEVENPRDSLEDDWTYDMTADEQKYGLLAARTIPITTNHFLLQTIITEPRNISEQIINREEQGQGKSILNSIIKFINKEVSDEKVQKVWVNPNFKTWNTGNYAKTRVNMYFFFENKLKYNPKQNLTKEIGLITLKFRFAFYNSRTTKNNNRAEGFCNKYPGAIEYHLILSRFMMSKDDNLGSPMLKMELNRELGEFPEKSKQQDEDEEEQGEEEKEERAKSEKKEEKEEKEERVAFQCAWRKYVLLWNHFHNVSNAVFDMRVTVEKINKRETKWIEKFHFLEIQKRSVLQTQDENVTNEIKKLERIETNFKDLWVEYSIGYAQQ